MSTAFLPGNPMAGTLHAELRGLIAASRQRLAGAVNAELTRLYWTLGERLSREVLGGERAAYGQRLMERLGEQLSAEFGRGFDFKNLRRMVRFAEVFPAAEIDASVMRQLKAMSAPKAELEQQLHQMMMEARERLARRGILLGNDDER